MGAPFWSNEEKQYFLTHIVPRSHYANGYYDSSGRSFDDLASVMQRDLDERDLSRRTYNGDLLFQHWYQRVRPTAYNIAMSSAQGSALPPTTSQQGFTTGYQPVGAPALGGANQQSSSPTSTSHNDQAANNSEDELSLPEDHSEEAMADSTSIDGASNAQDKGEMTEQMSSSPRAGSSSIVIPTAQPVTNTAAEPTSQAANPPSAVPFTAPVRATKKRSIKETAIKGEAAQATSKKPKKAARKSTARSRAAQDSDEDSDEAEAVPNPNPRVASNEPGLPHRRFDAPALLPPFGGEYESPYRLSHPVPIPSDSALAASRELYANSNAYANSRPMHSTAGYQPRGSLSSSTARRHPLPSSQITPFTQEHAETARLQRRHAMDMAAGAFNTGHGYRGPGHAPGMASASASASALAGSAMGHTASGQASGPGAQGGVVTMRIDPVTGQRMGEVTLQGPTMMTYCPSCQRPF